MRHSTTSRTGDPDGAAGQLRVIDAHGVNRTPKPLVAIVPSQALRQAKALTLGDDTGTLGSEQSFDGFMGRLSSTSLGHAGWFSAAGSGMQTPLANDPAGPDSARGGALTVQPWHRMMGRACHCGLHHARHSMVHLTHPCLQ